MKQTTYLLGVGSHGVGKILSQAAPILLLTIFSQRISVEELGLLSFVVSLVSIFGLLSDLGLSDSQNKFLAESEKFLSPILNWEFVLAFAFGGLLYLLDLATHCFMGYGFYLFLTTIASTFYVVLASFSGLLKLVESGIYQTLATTLFFGGTLGLYHVTGKVIESFFLARMGSWALLNLWMLLKLTLTQHYTWDWFLPKKVWQFSLNTFWFSSVELLISQVDVLLVKYLLGDRMAGIFKPAALLGMAPMALGTLLSAPLLSLLSRQVTTHPEKAWKFVRNLFMVMGVVLGFGFLVAWFLARPLLSFLFTPEIATEGHFVFLLTLLSTCFYVLGMPLQEYFLAKDDAPFVRRLATLRLLLFFIFAFPSLSYGGINGLCTAQATVYSVSFVAYAYRFFSKQHLK